MYNNPPHSKLKYFEGVNVFCLSPFSLCNYAFVKNVAIIYLQKQRCEVGTIKRKSVGVGIN